MSDTPGTREVREAWSGASHDYDGLMTDEEYWDRFGDPAFDRWLKSIEDAAWDSGWRAGPWGRRPYAQSKAEAWDEGYTRGFYAAQSLPATADASEGAGRNPYSVPEAPDAPAA